MRPNRSSARFLAILAMDNFLVCFPSGSRLQSSPKIFLHMLASSSGYCGGLKAEPWLGSSGRHGVAEAEVTSKIESSELRLEAVAKSRLDFLARYG